MDCGEFYREELKILATDFTDLHGFYSRNPWRFVLWLDIKRRAGAGSLYFGEEGFPGVSR